MSASTTVKSPSSASVRVTRNFLTRSERFCHQIWENLCHQICQNLSRIWWTKSCNFRLDFVVFFTKPLQQIPATFVTRSGRNCPESANFRFIDQRRSAHVRHYRRSNLDSHLGRWTRTGVDPLAHCHSHTHLYNDAQQAWIAKINSGLLVKTLPSCWVIRC